MGNWNKPRPTTEHAFAVIPIGKQFGIGIFRPGVPPERVSAVGLRLQETKLERAVERMNSRIGVTRERAAEIVRKR